MFGICWMCTNILFFSYFLWGILSICGALMMIKIEMDDTVNFLVLSTVAFELVLTVITLFIFSDFGARVSNGFEGVCDGIYQLNWYWFPIDIRQMLLNVMAVAQQPVILQGLMNFSCTRDTFKNVSWLSCRLIKIPK